MDFLSFVLAVASVSLNALAQIALRKAMLTIGAIPSLGEPMAFILTFLRNVYLWGGMACYALSIALWLAVLSTTQVTVAYPMLSIGYVIAAVLSFFILGEMIPPFRLAGIALICVGVILISRTT